jgi:F0F1-type ATP synthase assembly protein I
MAFDYKKNRVWAENLTIVMQLGLTMAGCIVLCFFVGRYLDQWLGTRGVFITLLTVFGVIGGANVTYRQIIDITTDKNDKNKKTNHQENGND